MTLYSTITTKTRANNKILSQVRCRPSQREFPAPTLTDRNHTLGKAACQSKAIPESVLIDIVDEVGGISKITAISAHNDNTLVLTLTSGEQIVKRWQDRSRRDSWTPEMKEAARQRKLRKEVA